VTVNGYVAVPFWSIEPVNVSVVRVAVVVVVGVVTVEALEEDPHPASQNSNTIENARLQGRTTRAVNFMNRSLVLRRRVADGVVDAMRQPRARRDHVEPCDPERDRLSVTPL
jgi:hypothetical protein